MSDGASGAPASGPRGCCGSRCCLPERRNGPSVRPPTARGRARFPQHFRRVRWSSSVGTTEVASRLRCRKPSTAVPENKARGGTHGSNPWRAVCSRWAPTDASSTAGAVASSHPGAARSRPWIPTAPGSSCVASSRRACGGTRAGASWRCQSTRCRGRRVRTAATTGWRFPGGASGCATGTCSRWIRRDSRRLNSKWTDSRSAPVPA